MLFSDILTLSYEYFESKIQVRSMRGLSLTEENRRFLDIII